MEDPSLSLSQLLDQLNMNQTQKFGEPEVRQWVKSLSDENRGVWYQEETGSIMFV